MADVREANINVFGNWRVPVLKLKSGKAPGLDGFPVECLKKCGTALLEWLFRLLIVNFEGKVFYGQEPLSGDYYHRIWVKLSTICSNILK